MKKSAKNASLHEALRKLWKIRIMLEKGYTKHVQNGWQKELRA